MDDESRRKWNWLSSLLGLGAWINAKLDLFSERVTAWLSFGSVIAKLIASFG
jgi:hypothetical protein